MKAYIVKMGLAGPVSQPELLDFLKNEGCEAIQTSDGVCFKTSHELTVLQSKHPELAKLQTQILEDKDASVIKSLSPDIQNFIYNV